MLATGTWTRDLLLLVSLVALLFGFNLGGRALWSPVEGRYSEIPREMAISGDYVTPRLNGVKYFEKPPLFYWLQAFSIKAFGLNEWSLRFWNALFGVLGCVVVYAAGRELYSRRTGWLAAGVLALSPMYYAMARVISLDMALTFFLSAALTAFLLGARKRPGWPRRLFMWTFYAALALATLTKGLVGIVLAALVIGFWIAILGQWSVLKRAYLFSGILIFAAIAAPWHLMVSQANPDFARFYFIREHFQRYFLSDQAPLQQAWVYVPVLLLGFFPWVAFLIQSLRHNLGFSWYERFDYETEMFLGFWAILIIAFFSASGSQLFTYILPAFPPLALLLGRTLSSWWKAEEAGGAMRAGVWAAMIAMVLFAAVVGFSGLEHGLERYSNWPSLETPSDDTTIPSTRLAVYPDLGKLRPYIFAQAAVLLCGAVALFSARRRGLRAVFTIMAATIGLFLVLLDGSFALLDDRRSVKDLAAQLGGRLQPAEEVATYHAYFQDLPVYLQRRVTVVEWKGELAFGMHAENVSDWMIDEAAFWRRWNGEKKMYAVTDRENYERLAARGMPNVHLLAQNDYNVILTNRPLSAPAAASGAR